MGDLEFKTESKKQKAKNSCLACIILLWFKALKNFPNALLVFYF